MKPIFYIFLLASAVFTVSCKQGKEQVQNLPDPLATNRDTTVNPGEDFFHYANGGWFKRNPIPETESNNGIWKLIGDTINAQVKQVCERSAADVKAGKGSDKQKIGDFYASGMDTVAIEAAGITPLKTELQRIQAIHDVPSLVAAIAHDQTIGADPAYGFYIGQDDKISTKYALFFSQGGLGLGDRDYYFNMDSRTKNIRKQYVAHVRKMLVRTGEDSIAAGKDAAVVMALETDLAKASRKLEDLRDPIRNYNKMTVDQFSKSAPDMNWAETLKSWNISGADTVIVGQPEFFTSLNVLLRKHRIDEWKSYLKWQLVDSYASSLSAEFDKEHFNFYGTVLSGAKKQRPRWKRVVQQTDRTLGELIGKVYVAEYLPKGAKEKLLEIGYAIRDVYAAHIKNLDWMSETTKQKALLKLSKITMKMGYPDKWKDMSALETDRSSYQQNIQRGREWAFRYMIGKFGKPVDRTEWGMYPHTYNAYYNPSNNEICLPACNVIVPGYEGRLPDDAILYGIVGGSTIGHEITHGFDDQGSQYDENGNLKDWWTAEDRKQFVSRTKQIVKQYSAYKVLDSMHVNGEATQGENIADLGGVVMGLEAFRKTNQYKEGKEISGLKPEQRYFLGYAFSWLVNQKNEAIARQIMTDVHSPEQYRVNGPLSDVPSFYTAFDVKEGQAMYRPDSTRVVIW